MPDLDYFKELPVAITVCDKNGIILYMNEKSATTFEKDGGAKLVGRSLLDCHPGASKEKVKKLLNEQKPNTYTVEKDGLHKMIQQTPWYESGEFRGIIEFSFEIPAEVPHFVRS
jgi:DUF438 domain-containing protein